MQPKVYLAVTHTARSNARTGIQTVTRGLSHGLRQVGEVTPIAWNYRRNYPHLLKPEWAANLDLSIARDRLAFSWRQPVRWLMAKGRHSHYPLDRHPQHQSRLRGSWMLLPELMDEPVTRCLIRFARRTGMHVAAIFHDAICLQHPELGGRDPAVHEAYMKGIAQADAVLCVSRQAQSDFESWLGRWNETCPRTEVVSLPAELIGFARMNRVKEPDANGVNILCVSTLEPRKNHRLFIECFLVVKNRYPEIGLTLQLAGAVYPEKPETAEWVSAVMQKEPSIRWARDATPTQLSEFYDQCDFSVYPSFSEGFGLPVVESLWFGRPCLCANTGPMSDNAEGGGCLTTDVQSKDALVDAIARLSRDSHLRMQLANEAVTRPLATWGDYASKVLSALDA